MKTAQDILDENSLVYYMGSGEDEVEGKLPIVLTAMEEYAKEVAIDFMLWRRNKNWLSCIVKDNDGHVRDANAEDVIWYQGYAETEWLSTEQLFKLYKKERGI